MALDEAGRRREQVVEELAAYGAAQSELGRQFARRMQMHVSDSRAMVEIIRADDQNRPLTPARLAERIGLTKGATSILLNRLETAGHVTRRRGHADRRIVTLHAGDDVYTASSEFFAPLRERLLAVMQPWSSQDLTLVAQLVHTLRLTLDAYVGTHDDDTTEAARHPPTGARTADG